MASHAQVVEETSLKSFYALDVSALGETDAPITSQPLKQAEEGKVKPSLVADSSTAEGAPQPPVLPSDLPEPITPDERGIVGLYPESATNIGIGHLRPKDISFLEKEDWPNSPLLDANWLAGAAIPIYGSPMGSHWGWIINGWLVPNNHSPIAIGRDASFLMLHTYYALYSFPVLEIRPDGWFRFQYTPAGTAWSHISQLNLGTVELTIESWEDRFLDVGQVYFRDSGINYALREQPGSDQAISSLVGRNSFIVPLEFQGDWMRVRVTQPTNACEFLPGARTAEGWMRWRDPEAGVRIWYAPKGC